MTKNELSVQQIVNLEEYVVLDIETTGFSPAKGGRIIEIGAIHVRKGKIISVFDELINPEQKINAKIIELTGITNEDLVGKPTYGNVLPRFFEFIKGKVLVIHNASFDWDRYLTYFFFKVGIQADNYIVDTYKLSRQIYPNEKTHNLDVLSVRLNLPPRTKHRALGDSEVTLDVFKAFQSVFREEYGIQETLVLEESAPEQKEFKYDDFIIRSAKFWEKKNSNRVLKRRIYLMLDVGQVYFDIMTQTWGNQSSNCNINFKEVERRLVNSPTKLNQLKGYVTKDMLMGYFGLTENDLRVSTLEAEKKPDIKRIAYWEKSDMRRIYVTLNEGSLFYDLVNKGWRNKNVSSALDIAKLEHEIFKILNVNSIEEMCRFNGDKKVA